MENIVLNQKVAMGLQMGLQNKHIKTPIRNRIKQITPVKKRIPRPLFHAISIFTLI